MLQLIRDRSQGLVVGVIVFFICLTFALFGVQQYLDARSVVIVAEVGGEEVGLREYQRAFQQLRQRAQAMLGEAFNSEQWGGDQAKLSALDYVVNERLLVQVIENANIRASDVQIASYIRTTPQFQNESGFSEAIYQQTVRALGFSEVGFEQQIRQDLVVNQLRAGIGSSAFTTTDELQRLEQYRQQTRDIGFAIVGIESFNEDIAPTDEEIRQYYDENIEDYRLGEKVSVSYLDLSIDALMAEVQISELELRAYYETNQANYASLEQRNANHILVQLRRDASAAEETIASENASELRELALAGTSFEELAKENSDDIGSKTDGGETGYFGRGVMAREFEAAVFAMSPNEVSEAIRTDFGFHIIRLKAIKPGGIKSFEEVRSDLTATYQREQAEALFFEQAERLADLVYEQPESLIGAAETLGLSVQNTGLVTRGDLGVLFSERVIAATFESDVLLEGLNSEPIELSDGRVIVVRVEEHKLSSLPPLENIRAEALRNLIDARALEAANAYGKSLVERLNNGEHIDTVLADSGFKWEQVDAATRESPKLNRAVLRAAFRADLDAVKKVLFIGVPIGRGDYGVVGVSNVRMPPIEQLAKSDINQLRRDVADGTTAAYWQDFIGLLKADYRIETFPERL